MIYLDHNATTPMAPEVREAMLAYLTEEWGNPSSSYRFGSKLKDVIEAACEQYMAISKPTPISWLDQWRKQKISKKVLINLTDGNIFLPVIRFYEPRPNV